MNSIRFMRTVRAVESEASARGYHGNIFSKSADIPLVGTLRQQLAIAAIGCDTSPGPSSTRDRELHNRFVRAVVLTSDHQVGAAPTSTAPDVAINRAWKRRGK